MSPALKYTLGRFGLFVVLLAASLPLPLNFLVKAMIALVVSAILSYFLLAEWRNQMGEQLASAASKRSAEKQRLRAALAGDDDAALASDRVALADAEKLAGAEKSDKAAKGSSAKKAGAE